jgi:DNA-binding GntR family transcriptional regulator
MSAARRTAAELRSALPSERTTSSVARACTVIRKAIQDGAYEGGSWIREVAVAARASVSRTSVRQALNVLAAEGFVELHPNRGAMVVDWTEENLRQAFELRAMVESYGCELAAKHRSEEDLEALRREAERFAELVERRRVDARIVDSDNRFHRLILGAARNPRMASLLSAVVQAPFMTQTFRRYDAESLRRSAMHHSDLVTAIAAGDAEWAHATMRVHVLAARYLIFGARPRAKR